MTPLLRCDPRMGATTVSLMDGHIWRWAENIPSGFEPGFEPRLAHYSNVTHIMVCLARLRKTHTYPVWGMTTLRQFRSSGPMRAPCSRGLSLGHFMLNVYSVLFLCIPGTLAAPCLTCFGFQPGCTFETTGKCPLVEIPVANLAITAKAGVGGALVLQNAVSNKYNRVINREGLNSLQALMRRPFDGTPVTAQ